LPSDVGPNFVSKSRAQVHDVSQWCSSQLSVGKEAALRRVCTSCDGGAGSRDVLPDLRNVATLLTSATTTERDENAKITMATEGRGVLRGEVHGEPRLEGTWSSACGRVKARRKNTHNEKQLPISFDNQLHNRGAPLPPGRGAHPCAERPHGATSRQGSAGLVGVVSWPGQCTNRHGGRLEYGRPIPTDVRPLS